MIRAVNSTKMLIRLSNAWAHKIREIGSRFISWLVARVFLWFIFSPIMAALWGGIIIGSYQTLIWLRHGRWPQISALDGFKNLAEICGSQDAWLWLSYPQDWVGLHGLMEKTPLFLFFLFSTFPLAILAILLFWVFKLIGPFDANLELLRIAPRRKANEAAIVKLIRFTVVPVYRIVIVLVFTFVDLLIICAIFHDG